MASRQCSAGRQERGPGLIVSRKEAHLMESLIALLLVAATFTTTTVADNEEDDGLDHVDPIRAVFLVFSDRLSMGAVPKDFDAPYTATPMFFFQPESYWYTVEDFSTARSLIPSQCACQLAHKTGLTLFAGTKQVATLDASVISWGIICGDPNLHISRRVSSIGHSVGVGITEWKAPSPPRVTAEQKQRLDEALSFLDASYPEELTRVYFNQRTDDYSHRGLGALIVRRSRTGEISLFSFIFAHQPSRHWIIEWSRTVRSIPLAIVDVDGNGVPEVFILGSGVDGVTDFNADIGVGLTMFVRGVERSASWTKLQSCCTPGC